jgi:muramoyltetrapeptide carboxypeptidase
MIIQPPFLKKGQCIGITCPASFLEFKKAEKCIAMLQQCGFEVVSGNTLYSTSENYFSAPDEVRLNELQEMLDNPSIHAILFGRGGYGIGRIIDKLNFKKFRKHPKWIIGFSDITLLHQHIVNRYQIATLHAPMAAAFNDPDAAPFIGMLHKSLIGKSFKIETETHPYNTKGKVTAAVTGGNLSLLCNSIGTPSALKTKGKILLLEDVGEYLYSIDRMLYQLKRSGMFKHIKGLILGGFTELKDTSRPFGMQADDLLLHFTKELDCPVAFHFPVGHSSFNAPIKLGVQYTLTVTDKKVSFKEA